MTLKQLAKKLSTDVSELEERAGSLVIKRALRAVEAELYGLMARYKVKTIDEFDKKIAEGKFTEEEIGEDFFRFDYLQEKKEKLEELLAEFPEEETLGAWTAIANLPASLRLSFPR